MEKALRQGTSLELRVQTVNRLRESIGFSLAKDILRSTPQALTVSQSQQRDLILSKAKAVGERQARFEVYGKVDNLQDCLQRLPNEWYTPGKLNVSHRLFVLSTTLLYENEKMPWAACSRSTWTQSQMKDLRSLLKTMKTEAAADGEPRRC